MIDTTTYKARLEEEKSKLESELESLGRRNPANKADWEATPPETGSEPDPVDSAEQKQEFDDNAAILSDLETRYNEVLSALERIEKGTYGICVISGQPIEEDRLEADPAAATCKAHLNG
jgi:RNA polymerase-binding transcription factor DksA